MSFDISDVIRRAIVPAAVISVFALLRKYMPARTIRAQGDEPVTDDFTRTNRAVYGAMILIGIALAFLTHKALVATNLWLAEADGPATFRLLPSSFIWWFLPGVAALCLSWEITLFFWSKFGDHQTIARFLDWTHKRAGFDSTRALRWMALLIVMPIGIASVLAIPIHSSLRDNEIVVGRYARLARQYLPYSDARRFLLVDGFRDRNGKFTARSEVLVVFQNGVRWSSAANRDFMTRPDSGLVEFLERKTGLAVEHAESETDLR